MELQYIEIKYDGKSRRYEDESRELLEELFNFLYGNRLVICHPNNMFKKKPVNSTQKDFDEIDWRDLRDPAELYDVFQYNSEDKVYMIEIPGDYSGFTYIHKRFRNELFQDGDYRKKLKTENPRHLVLIEQHDSYNMYVRAIFRATKDKFEVAINPEFMKRHENISIFENMFRMYSEEYGYNS